MEALRRRVLPELLRRAAGRDRPLTHLERRLLDRRGALHAGDADARALADARLAGAGPHRRHRRLGRRAAGGRPGDVHRPDRSSPRRRWCRTGGSSRAPAALGVKDAARALVELRLHNLVTEPPPFAPGEVDLIVCRNVTIYFNRATTSALVGSFHDVLAEGGYLLLGHSETLWQVSDAFALVPVGDAFVYRKSHDSRRGVADAAPPLGAGPLDAAGRCRRVPSRRRVRAVPVAAAPAGRRGPPDVGGAALLAAARGHLAAGDYAAAARRGRGRGARRPVARAGVRRAGPGPLHAGPGRRGGRPAAQGRLPRPDRRRRALPAGRRPVPARAARRRRGVLPGRGRVPAAPGRRHPSRPARRPRPGRAGRPVRDAGRQLRPHSPAAVCPSPSREPCRERLGHLRDGLPRDGRRPGRGARGRARHRARGAAPARARRSPACSSCAAPRCRSSTCAPARTRPTTATSWCSARRRASRPGGATGCRRCSAPDDLVPPDPAEPCPQRPAGVRRGGPS